MDYELTDHTKCPAEAHHPDWDAADAASNPDQATEHGHLSCNDDGAPMFYCDTDDWYHHANASTPACFLIKEEGSIVAGAPFTAADAALLIADGDRVRTFAQTGYTPIGADMDRAEVLALLETGRCEVAGPEAAAMGHGLVVMFDTDRWPVFIQTRYTYSAE